MAGTSLDYFGGTLPGTTSNLDPSSASKPAGSAGLAVGTGTGRLGVVPILSDLGGGVGELITDFWEWLKTPFGPISPGNLALMVMVVFAAIIAWNFMLYHVRIAAEAI
jgi:hypothetical protein